MITEISVVIPVYNENNNIKFLTDEIKSSLYNKIKYEIIFIDDGSTDSTLETLLKIKKNEKNIFVINHEINYGQSIALRTGVSNSNYDHIVTLDGDGQNDPKDILRILKLFDEKKEFMMVIGNRVNRNDRMAKKIASRLAYKVRKIILKDDTPDTGCAIKVFRKSDFINLPFFNHIHRFMPYLFKTFKGNVISIEVNHRARKSGVSKYSNLQRFLVGIYDILGVIWLKKRTVWPINYKKNKKN